MACHHLLEPYVADGMYFAVPASPWLRGTKENTNGLLHQHVPQGSDLRAHALADGERSNNASTAVLASDSLGAAPAASWNPSWQVNRSAL